MLHNELEYRNAKKELNNLRAEVEKRSLAAEGEIPESSRAVVEALEMKISDIEHEIVQYRNLKAGHVSSFAASDLDEFGEVVTKARIAKGWSQADLAEALDTHHQQIQRYERNDWQKINLWRLQEVVEALGLDVAIHARFHDHEGQDTEALQTMSSERGLHYDAVSSLGLSTGETLGDLGASVGETLGGVIMIDAAARKPRARHNAPQMILEEYQRASGGTSGPRLMRIRPHVSERAVNDDAFTLQGSVDG